MSVFKVTVRQEEKLRMKCTGEKHEMLIDEPERLGGTDLAMNPLEVLLSSFGACMSVHAWLLAERMNIRLKDVCFELEGETGPYERVGNITPVGFRRIHTRISVEADNSQEEIDAFVHEIETRCPVRNTLIHAVECTSETTIK